MHVFIEYNYKKTSSINQQLPLTRTTRLKFIRLSSKKLKNCETVLIKGE